MFETSDTSPVEGVELGDFILARARLEHAPEDVAAVVAMLKLPDADAWRRVDQAWRGRMDADKRLARVVDEFVVDHVRALQGDVDDGDDERPAEPAPAVPPQPVAQQVPSYLQLGAVPVPPPVVVTAPPVVVAAPPSPVASPPPPVAFPPPAVVAPPPSRRSSLGETAPLDLSFLRTMAAKSPTPFAGKTSPEQLQKLRDAETAAEETQLHRPAAGGDEVDETAMYQPTPSQRVGFQTLPFDAAKGKAAVFPEMDVDRYAAFVVQLEVRRDHAEILVKHGVTTPKALVALRAEQERRFEQDPVVRARFEERKAHFKRFMKPAP